MSAFPRFINPKGLIISLLFLMMFMITACSTTGEDPGEDEDILVTAITVTSANNATTITDAAGTLQMSASILPDNATDATFTWSVINNSGIATISSDGLLTAEADGTVTVSATSVSTPAVSGAKTITISNQPDPDMATTLTKIDVDGIDVMGFNPLVSSYVHLISSDTTQTPTVTATTYDTTATVDITPAIDVTSQDSMDRTTTITVTATDGDNQKTYTIVFESQTEPVALASAGDFVILAEAAVSSSPDSIITGDIGLSPAAASYFTGFSLTMHASGEYATSDQVTGNLYASDYVSPTPSNLTTAIEDMLLAYADAAGRTANYNELYSGDLSGKTLSPGVFKFGNTVLINTDLTLNGSETDVWIFQISGNLTMASNVNIILEGGADAKNIFWQVADSVTIGSGAHFEGTILGKTNIALETGASINGRLYAQTAVTLDEATVTKSND